MMRNETNGTNGTESMALSIEVANTGDHVILTVSDWSTPGHVTHRTIRLDQSRATFMGATLRHMGTMVTESFENYEVAR